MSIRIWKTEYKLVKWESPEELVLRLNSEQEFKTELTRLYKDGAAGWTIFSRSYEIEPPYLDSEIRLEALYRILNSAEVRKAAGVDSYMTSDLVVSEIDRQLKEHYKQYVVKSDT